jgi:hypothetical protein
MSTACWGYTGLENPSLALRNGLRVKVAAMTATTDNPSEEPCWVSCLRKNFISNSYGEELETGPAPQGPAPRQFLTRHHQCTAFSGDDILCLMKDDRSEVTDRSGVAVFVFGAEGLSSVLRDEEVMFFRQVVDAVHLSRSTRVMDRRNRLRAGRNCRLDERLIDVQGIGPDVDEHGYNCCPKCRKSLAR